MPDTDTCNHEESNDFPVGQAQHSAETFVQDLGVSGLEIDAPHVEDSIKSKGVTPPDVSYSGSDSEPWIPEAVEPPWIGFTTLEMLWKKRGDRYTANEKAEAWNDSAEVVKTFSDEMIHKWNKEIDTLLVYAGLFSAILTAFNVQSYPLLSPDPPDPVLAALTQISVQLAGFTINSSLVNSTAPIFVATDTPPPPPPRWAVWLNILWFSSLVCSLAATSIGLTVKQWLNHCALGLSGTSREVSRLRQYRLNGLQKWRVDAVVAILPVLLQLALALFSVGLLLLLWNLHHVVAVVVAALLGTLLLFTLVTSLLPAFFADCVYLSPQALAIFYLYTSTIRPRRWVVRNALIPMYAYLVERLFVALELCHGCAARLFASPSPDERSLKSRFDDYMCNLEALQGGQCAPAHATWRGREQQAVLASSAFLDADILSHAYDVSLDGAYLDRAAICSAAFNKAALTRYFCHVRGSLTKHTRSPIAAGDPLSWVSILRSRPAPGIWHSLLVLLLKDREDSEWNGTAATSERLGSLPEILGAMTETPLSGTWRTSRTTDARSLGLLLEASSMLAAYYLGDKELHSVACASDPLKALHQLVDLLFANDSGTPEDAQPLGYRVSPFTLRAAFDAALCSLRRTIAPKRPNGAQLRTYFDHLHVVCKLAELALNRPSADAPSPRDLQVIQSCARQTLSAAADVLRQGPWLAVFAADTWAHWELRSRLALLCEPRVVATGLVGYGGWLETLEGCILPVLPFGHEREPDGRHCASNGEDCDL
ncbi:hypothetical protein C8Q79DRAFT_1037483 [Trametes meyenii]|nr:hypothetical protein C8Q79DRAFT_1037483 [Trametes meyenii]